MVVQHYKLMLVVREEFSVVVDGGDGGNGNSNGSQGQQEQVD